MQSDRYYPMPSNAAKTMLTVTFIRHGESEDNLIPIWAGWRDSPLSQFGRKQAAALGKSFASTRINAIYSSDLKRAHSTARAIQACQSPTPPIHVSRDLREMNFGLAEGNPWQLNYDTTGMSTEEFERLCALYNVYPMIHERDRRYPEGESYEDVAGRADKVIKDFVLPHLIQSQPNLAGDDYGVPKPTKQHIAITSHGMCIGELVPALLRLDPEAVLGDFYGGLHNTSWFRAVVEVRDVPPSAEPPVYPPPLKVTLTHYHQMDHLDELMNPTGEV